MIVNCRVGLELPLELPPSCRCIRQGGALQLVKMQSAFFTQLVISQAILLPNKSSDTAKQVFHVRATICYHYRLRIDCDSESCESFDRGCKKFSSAARGPFWIFLLSFSLPNQFKGTALSLQQRCSIVAIISLCSKLSDPVWYQTRLLVAVIERVKSFSCR